MRVDWLTAFLDRGADEHATATAYWAAVTGYDVSPSRGEHGEFTSLLPPDGARDHLRLQRLADGPSRIHLDLGVPDLRPATEEAVTLGARLLDAGEVSVLASPGGFVFCLVAPEAGAAGAPDAPGPAAAAASWPQGRSTVDQVCLDIPADAFERECAFWSALTGWEVSEADDEFRRLRHQPGFALQVLLQRLEEPTGRVRAHLDLSADDRDAEVARHQALGGRLVGRYPDWTVLADPGGAAYCVTVRTPR